MTFNERLCVRAPVYGRHGMVVAGHSAATLAGISALKRGGSIIDAMVAASAALTVTVGQATSIGGDCFLLFHEAKSGRTVGLNASGTAPQGATPERFADGMKIHGPLAPVVPGIVRGWDVMHCHYGVLPWQTLFDDAIALAEGYPVSHSLAERFSSSLERIKADPGCASIYMPNGRAIQIGDVLRQPALARTLRTIADDGADAFYDGAVAQQIGTFFEERGGLIRASDLAAYEPLWSEPAASDYRGYCVEVMPPNSLGVLLLMQLNGLAALDSTTLMEDAGRRAGYQMSALKAAADLSKRWIADPRAVPNAVAHLTGAEMTAQMQAAVCAPAAPARVRNTGGTACLLIADEYGNAVSMVQSVFNVFGAALLDPQTGILFNNRMQGFTHKPDHPNSVAPGKRPAHTLCPVLVRRDGRVCYVLATPGGISQTLTNVQVINYLIDGGMDVAAAVDAPRWCNTKTGEFLLEASFPESIIATLADMGHSASQADDPYYYGSAKAIELLSSGMLAGAGDRHREAAALGY